MSVHKQIFWTKNVCWQTHKLGMCGNKPGILVGEHLLWYSFHPIHIPAQIWHDFWISFYVFFLIIKNIDKTDLIWQKFTETAAKCISELRKATRNTVTRCFFMENNNVSFLPYSPPSTSAINSPLYSYCKIKLRICKSWNK